MNNTRRKVLKAALEKLEAIRDQVQGEIENLVSEVQGVLDEEQEAFDALPDGLQEGRRGESMQSAIGLLEEAVGNLEELQGVDFDSITQAIEGAME